MKGGQHERALVRARVCIVNELVRAGAGAPSRGLRLSGADIGVSMSESTKAHEVTCKCPPALCQCSHHTASERSAPRTFPIQVERGAEPHPLTVPWAVAELAYSVYAQRFGTSQSLDYIAARGGFGATEMDRLLPGWRNLKPAINFDQIGADRLADEVAALVSGGKLDSRSPAADALLDYRNPPRTPRSDRLALQDAREAALVAAARGWPDKLRGLARFVRKHGDIDQSMQALAPLLIERGADILDAALAAYAGQGT